MRLIFQLCIFMASLFFANFAYTQTKSIKIGTHLAIPISGDVSKAYKYNTAIDLSYFYKISDKIDLGGTTGFNYLSGKTVNYTSQNGTKKTYTFEDGGYIPILVSGIFHFNDKISLWLDEGTGIFPREGEKVAYVYERKIGYTPIKKIITFVGYKGFSRNGLSAGAIMIGGRYQLNITK